jgi:hypothetical protein
MSLQHSRYRVEVVIVVGSAALADMAARSNMEGCGRCERIVAVWAVSFFAVMAVFVRIEHYNIGVVIEDLDATDHAAAIHAVCPIGGSHRSPLG